MGKDLGYVFAFFKKKMQSQALSGFWGRDDGKEDSINLSLSPGH